MENEEINVDQLIYGKVHEVRLLDETRVEFRRRQRKIQRDNMLGRLVPDRCCSSCECVKVRRKAWVVLSERRSTLLERLSTCLSIKEKHILSMAIDCRLNYAASHELYEITKLRNKITKVQRSKICCRGCWIKFRNKARAYDVE